jgi:hypothetical protein
MNTEKNVRNCIRNCWRFDKCSNCEFFKSVQQAWDELDEARRLFNMIKFKKHMKWIKFTKYFQGGVHSDYRLVEEQEIETDDQKNELMENWGENTDGGHNYGYRVEMQVLEDDEIPPKEWLEKAVKSSKNKIKYLKEGIKKEIELMNRYNEFILEIKK